MPKLLAIDDVIVRVFQNSVKNGIIPKHSTRDRTATSKVDYLISLFHAQLVSKVSAELTSGSFDEFCLFIE